MINRLPTLSQEETGETGGLPSLDWSALQSWRREVEHFIGQHPVAVLAASLSVGFLIGWWKKRS